jgi:UDP-glucose 4-epimerase
VSGRRALVTGGAGFIGGHLVETLLAEGWLVRVLDDFSSGSETNLDPIRSRIELLRGSCTDPDTVASAVEGAEVVFHLAAIPSVPSSVADPLRTNEVNVTGTLVVLDSARVSGVRRVVYAASTAAYGDSEELPKREDMHASPRSPYALQKFVGEVYCRLYHELYGLETLALRYFNVFGPRQDPKSQYAAVIPLFVTACLRGEAPRIFGDGEQTRDFTYVEDVVRANLLAADAPAARGEVVNVARAERTSLNRLLAMIQGIVGSDVDPTYEPSREGDVRDSLADLGRARELLAYEPVVPLEEGLRRTVAYFEQSSLEGALA